MLLKVLLVGVAVALILSPTLRLISQWAFRLLLSRVEAEVRKLLPQLSAKLDEVSPSLLDAGANDMRVVLDLAAKLRDQGQTEAVKLCQQLLDQMLQPKA